MSRNRRPWAICATSSIIAAVTIGGEGMGQTQAAILRNPDGAVACIVSRPALTSIKPDYSDTDWLVVDLRAPATPSAALLASLPTASRDFGALPIEVLLVPSADRATGTLSKPRRINPLSIESAVVYPTLDGVVSTDPFVRVTYPRDVLQAGVDIVAQRTATAENGEKVTSETRCRIRDEDAVKWQ